LVRRTEAENRVIGREKSFRKRGKRDLYVRGGGTENHKDLKKTAIARQTHNKVKREKKKKNI